MIVFLTSSPCVYQAPRAIINPENNALYQQYRELAGQYGNLHLLGRLAEYKYYNMDAIADRALTLSRQLLG